jgi:hypothetical protein
LIPNAGGKLIPGLIYGPGGTTATAAPAAGTAGGTAAGVSTVGLGVAGGAAGAIALGYLIGQKGLFRGGEEGIEVNPKRDAMFKKFVDQFGGQFSPYESFIKALEQVGVVGERANKLITEVYAADTMAELRAAWGRVAGAGLTSFIGGINTEEQRADLIARMREQFPELGSAEPRTTATTVNIQPGAITVQGVDDPRAIAEAIVGPLVDLIVRENANGSRTILRRSLVTA